MTYAALIKAINSATTQLQGRAAAAVNQLLVLRNWMVGAWIVEFEQTGRDRARYGQLIAYTLSAELPTPNRIPYALSTESTPRIRGTLSREFSEPLESAPLLRHSRSQIQRPIESLLYERTDLSTSKKAAIERARRQAPPATITDQMRDPCILEFTGLSDLPAYSEDQLESALLDHLRRFLLELGRGFCLIVNWFKARILAEGDAPPVGILLCSGKDGAEVECATAGMDQALFVSRYLTALPSAKRLRAFLESDRAHFESRRPPRQSIKRLPQRTRGGS